MTEQPPREQATLWRDPALGDLEMLRATYVRHVFARHTHDGFCVGVVERGAEVFDYRGAAHLAPAGSIILINPGEPHNGQAAVPTGWAYRTLYPAAERLQRAAAELAGRSRDVPFFPAPIVHDPVIAGELRALHVACEAGVSPLERETRLLAVLARLIARHADDPTPARALRPAAPAVARARDYLESRLADEVTLDDLARLTGFSPFHLVRLFRAETGLPPHAYLTQARVTRAKGLLAGGLPIARVAAETGFSDQSHLTRHFKRLVGVTPGEYAGRRKNVQDGAGAPS